MIEALIAYIQEQGYSVDVLPERLIIRKYVDGQLLSLGWGIAKIELQALDWDTLKYATDRKLMEFTYAEQAAKRAQSVPLDGK